MMKGSITKSLGYSIWQKSFHDHIIRGEADYLRIWEYIDTNPAKWREDCYYTEQPIAPQLHGPVQPDAGGRQRALADVGQE